MNRNFLKNSPTACKTNSITNFSFSGYEGKAGMASITLKPNKSLDLEKVYEQVVTFLPAYACPQFLRIQVILPTPKI